MLQGIFTVFRVLGCILNWKSTQFFDKTRKEMEKVEKMEMTAFDEVYEKK